ISGTSSTQAVSADGDIIVQAGDHSTIDSLAGAVALGLGAQGVGVAVGASLSYNYLGGAPLGTERKHTVSASIHDTEGEVSGDRIQVASLVDAAINNITLAGSVAVGTVAVAVGGAVSVNRISGENEASIRNARLV